MSLTQPLNIAIKKTLKKIEREVPVRRIDFVICSKPYVGCYDFEIGSGFKVFATRSLA